MCALEVKKNPYNSPDILHGQEKRKRRDFFNKEIENIKLEGKESKNDKKLQEFAQQGEDIGAQAIKLTEQGLKEYRHFPAVGVYDGGKDGLSADAKEHEKNVRFMNHTHAWQCSYDLEEIRKRFVNYMQGFKEVRDLFLRQKEKKASIGVKEFNDTSKLAESLQKQTSERTIDIKEQSDEIQKIEINRIKYYNNIKLFRQFGRYKDKSMGRIEDVGKNIAELKEQYKMANELKLRIDNIASNLVEGQREEYDKQVKELEQLCNHQKGLIDKLNEVIKAEEDYCRRIGDICDKTNPNGKLVGNIKKEEIQQLKNCVQEVQKAEQGLDSACKELLQMNLNSADLALERLNKIPEKDSLHQIKDTIEEGQTFLYFHPRAGKIIINGVFWPMHRIEEVITDKGQTKIQWDTNRANLVIETFTKEGLQTKECPYIKTLANEIFEAENFRFRFVASDAGGTARPRAKMFIQRKLADGKWDKEEEHKIDLASLRTLRIQQRFSEKGDVQIVVSQEDEVMPDIPDLKLAHDSFLKSTKPGFEPEIARRMWMMHLPTETIIFPNGRRMRFADVKWNAIAYAGEDRGPETRNQGPTADLPYLSLFMAGLDLQSPKMVEDKNELNNKIDNYLSYASQLLKDALRENNEEAIKSIFCHIENNLSRNISQIELMKNAYRDPPKNRDHKDQNKIEVIGKEIHQVDKVLSDGEGIYKSAVKYGEELNKSIQGINLKDVTPEAQQRRDEIKDVCHLNETFEVELLEDPNLGAEIQKIARKAGEAAYTIEELKSPLIAKKAQIDAENTIINEFIKARNEYPKESFYNAIQKNILQYMIKLQAKAEVVKNAKEEKYVGIKDDSSDEYKKFLKKNIKSAYESEEIKIVKDQIDKITKNIRKENLSDVYGNKMDKIDNYKKEINKVVEDVKKTFGEEAIEEKTKHAIEAAIETAWMLEKYGLEGKKKISAAAEKAKIEAKARGKDKSEQYKCAVEAAMKTGFKLAIYGDDQKDIEQEYTEDVNKLISDAKAEIDKLNGKQGEEYKKFLKDVEKSNIEKAWKLGLKPEEEDQIKELVKAAHSKLKKAKEVAEADANSDWDNLDERGKIVAKAKLDAIEENINKEIKEKNDQRKTEQKKELSEPEKDAIRMRIAVQKAYEIKNLVEEAKKSGNGHTSPALNVQIEDIPEELGNIDTSANKINEIAKEWAPKLQGSSQPCKFDGVQLIRERQKLKGCAKDPSDNLSLAERYDHFLKRAKLKQIENIIDNDQKVHYSYRIMLNMARAYEAALEDNYFWKDENKVKIEGALHYLENVKTEAKSHKTKLGELREDFLHQVVEFVRSGIRQGTRRQANSVMLPFLARAQRALEADLDNLELVGQVLDSKTPDEAKKIKDKLNDKLSAENQRSVLGLDNVEGTQKKVARDIIKEVEDRLMKNGRFDFEELAKLPPSEIHAWRGEILQKFHKKAETIFESTLYGLNSEQRAIMEKNRAFLIDKTTERLWNDYQKMEDRSFQLHKIGKFTKEVNKQRWMDAILSWFLTSMNNFTQISDRGANIFTQELEKLMKV